MRILHFVPDIGKANGIMSAVINFARSMPEDIIFDVVYFHETDSSRKEDIELLGGRVYKINKPSPKAIVNKELINLFKDNEWEALHIHAPHFAVFIAPYARKYGINKICVHCHSTEYSLKGNSSRNKLLSFYSRFFVNKKFACSVNAGIHWYGNSNFTVVNNAVDCKLFDFDINKRYEIRNDLDLDESFVVAHIGRTDIPQKNHMFLLKTFNEILKKNHQSVLLLIGAEETDELLSYCKANKLENNVLFLGIRNDISELLQASDLFLFPSTKEGLPVSVIEAQAAGLPCVISNSITNELCVTNLVKQMSLKESETDWANCCLSFQGFNRKSVFEEIKNAGWDISSASSILSSYYKE